MAHRRPDAKAHARQSTVDRDAAVEAFKQWLDQQVIIARVVLKGRVAGAALEVRHFWGGNCRRVFGVTVGLGCVVVVVRVHQIDSGQ